MILKAEDCLMVVNKIDKVMLGIFRKEKMEKKKMSKDDRV